MNSPKSHLIQCKSKVFLPHSDPIPTKFIADRYICFIFRTVFFNARWIKRTVMLSVTAWVCGRQLRAAVLSAAAHRCGTTRCARGRHQIPQQQTSASPSARTELGGLKVQKEGRFATQETAKKLGCMRPPLVRLGQVSEKGRVNRNSTSRILSAKPGSS
jgi:hypothetical protein